MSDRFYDERMDNGGSFEVQSGSESAPTPCSTANDASSVVEVKTSDLRELLDSMEHAQTFIETRQKMHADGRKLFQENIFKLKELLSYRGA